MARMKKQVIKSGKMLEVTYYPVNGHGKKIPNEPAKTTKTKEQMNEANRRKAIKKFVRLINCNFDENDYYVTLTYEPEFAPFTYEEAQRDFTNFIARVKTKVKANGGNIKNFKYAYTPQVATYKRGILKGRNNYHFHLFMSGEFLSSEDIKSLWKFGTKGNVEHYDPYLFGPELAAKYMSKSHTGDRMYRCSRNMKKPIVEEEKNALVSPKSVEELGRNRCDDARYWEQRYPSYRFVRMDKVFNEINGCWYLDVVMYKKPKFRSHSNYYEKSRKAFINSNNLH